MAHAFISVANKPGRHAPLATSVSSIRALRVRLRCFQISGFARVLRFGRNRGFGAATNAGIRATASRYVATLNNDAVPAAGWLAALVAAADAEPSVGMCGSRMGTNSASSLRSGSPAGVPRILR